MKNELQMASGEVMVPNEVLLVEGSDHTLLEFSETVSV
jgi:hypothetical protein